MTILAPELGFKDSVHTSKHESALHRRAPAVFTASLLMLRNEKLAGSSGAKQINSHDDRSYDHGVRAV
jgi:hypothetical protein